MKLLKRIGRGVVGSLLTILLILTIFLFGLVDLTRYENLRSVSYSFLEPKLKEKINYKDLEIICQFNKTIEFEVEELGNISVPCSEIKEENFLQPFVYAIFDRIYYKEYRCEFLECIKQTPLVIFSAHANTFLSSIQPYMIFTVLLLIILFLFLSEDTKERLKGLGSILTFCGLQFFFSMYIINLMHLSEVKQIIDVIFSRTYIYFGVAAVCGVILLIFSLVFNEKNLINKK